MASRVGASSTSESLVDKMLQMLFLGCAGTAAGLSWSWSAIDAGSLVVRERLLGLASIGLQLVLAAALSHSICQGGVEKRSKVVSKVSS